jgi:hypothetical protein
LEFNDPTPFGDFVDIEKPFSASGSSAFQIAFPDYGQIIEIDDPHVGEDS